MSEQPQDQPVRFTMELADGQAAGAHADLANIWHTPESFVIDFLAVTAPVRRAEVDDGTSAIEMDVIVTSRVRMAPTHVFELMRALERQLTAWETETGRRSQS